MKASIGDIVEIKTAIGLAYALYTHRHEKRPTYGAMLRVFDEVFPFRPERIDSVVRLPVRFNIFFPLQAAVNRGLVQVVGNVDVPGSLQAFPIFRVDGLPDPSTKKISAWWLWDGEKEWPIANLTPELKRLSIRGVWNDTMLIQRIEEGWRPENDARSA